MAFPVVAVVSGAMQLIEIYANYVNRAQHMTEEEAEAEWARVNDRAKAARELWENASGP
jgi:hypothetical protein